MIDTTPNLQYLITIAPLGMLYGSAGPFLSPDSLVGRSGNRFPPSATTVAGLYGATQWQGKDSLNDLYITGPFWAEIDRPASIYVPVPLSFRIRFNATQKTTTIAERWEWEETWGWHLNSRQKEKASIDNAWISIEHWADLQQFPTWPQSKSHPEPEEPDEDSDDQVSIPVLTTDRFFSYHPHLHPRLESSERHVVRKESDTQQGSLFLENAVQVNPSYCLAYLSSRPLESGWYRFGGEGHMADVQCAALSPDSTIAQLLQQPLGNYFSLLVPAVWGTQRYSYRFPVPNGVDRPSASLHDLPSDIQAKQETKVQSYWDIKALMTARPIPFRFRLGGSKEAQAKRLSRGRYAVPAGTVYNLATELAIPWQQWQKEWFPRENYSYQHWGCGFALPLAQQP